MGLQDERGHTSSSTSRLVEQLDGRASQLGLTLDEIESLNKKTLAAEAAWPGVQIPRDRFIGFLVARLPKDKPLDAALDRLASSDLYLACACIEGGERAVRVLNSIIQEVARTAVASVGVDEDVVDEVGQEFATQALIGSPTTPPLLASYKGLAPLRSWLRLMMVRRAIQLQKRQEKNRPYEDEIMGGLALDAADPELSYLKAHHFQEFHSAFRAALLELDVQQRNILRFLVVEGMSVQEIANFYRVNRRSIYKQRHNIEKRLLKQTRHHLSLHLRAGPTELDSIMRLMQSRLEITVGCLAKRSDNEA